MNNKCGNYVDVIQYRRYEDEVSGKMKIRKCGYVSENK